METEKKLELGVAYHGNRILKHVEDDMLDIVKHNMNLVVHMYTHNDLVRNKKLMTDIFKATTDLGLDFWVDNWGLMGGPGDPAHILQYHPDSHRVFSNGEVDPLFICFNSEHFHKFTKDWIDAVGEAGGKKLFWDEPHFTTKDNGAYACCCPRCREKFFDKYGKDMPDTVTEEVEEFRIDTLKDYFGDVTEYAHKYGMYNISCLQTISLQWTRAMLEIPYMDNFGTDPYEFATADNIYDYIYDSTQRIISQTTPAGKDNHMWIKTFRNPAGTEDDIFHATDAAYDAGARSIIAWSFRGGSPCDYHSDNIEKVWHTTGEAMRRIKDRDLDAYREKRLKKYIKD